MSIWWIPSFDLSDFFFFFITHLFSFTPQNNFKLVIYSPIISITQINIENAKTEGISDEMVQLIYTY